MNSPPVARPSSISESSPRSKTINPNHVSVLNAYWSGRPEVKAKVAERMVSDGRAEWVSLPEGRKALRLLMSHRVNGAGAAAATREYADISAPQFGRPDLEILRHSHNAADRDRYQIWKGGNQGKAGQRSTQFWRPWGDWTSH